MATRALKQKLSWSTILRDDPWRISPHPLAWQKTIVSDLRKRAPKVDGLWVLSSGTQSVGQVKAIALSFNALMVSAKAANKHLSAAKRDRWLLTLPLFHVGGLGILARAELSGSSVITLGGSWHAGKFVQAVNDERITLTSLVPTQIHDLVASGLRAPECLRAIVVGGAALAPRLYASARDLGWPLLPSYGLSECGSQVGTAVLSSLESDASPDKLPPLRVLPHVEMDLRESRIFLRSKSLCSFVAKGYTDGEFTLEDPTDREGWFATEDRAEWIDDLTVSREGKWFQPLGRRDDVVKILGELVSLPQIESEARAHFSALSGDLTVLAIADERAGFRLVLVTDSSHSLREWDLLRDRFNESHPGPQRLAQLAWVSKIPRGDLGKIQRARLRDELGFA